MVSSALSVSRAARTANVQARLLSTSASLRLAQPATATSSGAAAQLSPIALARAKDVESKWKGTSMFGGTTKNYVDGKFVESSTSNWLDVNDPVRLGILSNVAKKLLPPLY